MEIVYFHRKSLKGVISIQENFRPLIEEIGKDHEVKVYSVPYESSNPIKMLKNILYIRKHSTKTGINHITGAIHYGVLGLIGRKSVLTIHDDYAIRQARWGVLDKLYKYIFWIFLPIKIVDAPICTSPTTLNNIKKMCRSKKLKVITHHVVPSILKDNHKPFNKNRPTFLQIGTANNKNLETTFYAIKDMDCKLIVLKPMSDKQKVLAESLGIVYENKYDLPYEGVVKEYNDCDVVLFPSLFEGLGVPIFEGQAAGKVVITTNKEPMNWVAGNAAVLLNNPLDVEEYKKAIEKVISDDDFRKDLIKKGKDNAKRFSLENSVSAYLQLYKSLLG